jgi:hypothetical protein
MNQTQNNLQCGHKLPQFKHAFIKLPIKVKQAYRLNNVYDINNLEILMTKCGSIHIFMRCQISNLSLGFGISEISNNPLTPKSQRK